MSLANLEDDSCSSSGSGLVRGVIGTKGGEIVNSSDSSSIGKNSDVTGGEDSGDSTGEVESPYKGGLHAMEALEEVLPIRRGISRFYDGKCKSFASLARASSIQDLAKTENAYTRRRRNVLASTLIWDKNRFTPGSSSRSNGGGISKKTITNIGRTNLALAVAITATSSEADNNNSTITCHVSESDVNLVTPTCSPFQKPKPLVRRLSHLHRDMSTWRSFSLADLQCASAATSSVTSTSQCSAFGSTISDKTQSPF